MDQELRVDMTGEVGEIVTDERTAAALGSGAVRVFSTPALVALIENAAYTLVAGHLSAGQTTVGVEVSIKHLAATPVGMRVRALARLVRIDGRRLYFAVEAWDEVDKIGEGTHQRMIVERARFEERAGHKAHNTGNTS